MNLTGIDLAGLDLGEISREIERQQEKRRYDWKLQARPKQLAPSGKYRYFVVMAGRGFGKALSLDTEVPTPSGWTTMGEIKVGDMLFDESGAPCNVTFITDVMHGRTCYDVVFDDGTVIVADAEHQWVTDTHASRKAKSRRVTGAVSSKPQCQRRKECDPAIRTTDEIKGSLVYGNRERNHSIDVCGPLNLPDAVLPIHPYAFGAWLGDGDSKSFTMTSADPEIIAEMAKSGCSFQDGKKDPRSSAVRYAVTATAHKRDPVTGKSCSNGSMLSTLKAMGVFQNKHIPSVYLRSSVTQRMDLLCGLMDTDGYIQTNGNCEFTSTRKALASGVFELIVSLGFKATMQESVARLNGVDCGPKYRISFTPDRPVFRLTRKLARHNFTRAQKDRTRRRYIAEIRERESVPVRCLTVDSQNHLFLASRSFVPTHNTRCGAEYIRQLAEGGKHPILHILGPTAADVRDVMVEGPSGILACSPPWFMPEYEPSKRQIKWPNGVIAKTFSAEEPNRLRGPQCYGGWIDEIAAFDDPEAFTQFKLGYRLGSDLRCIITTTPKPCPIIHDLVKDEKTGKAIIVRGSTYENRQNLAEDFFADVISQYEGTRLGRQELEGELLEDTPGALWNTLLIDRTRVKREDLPPMARIVVAIDPSVTSNARSDECGIAVVGKGVNGDGYMLEDLSGVMTPNEWAMAAIAAYHRHSADVIVGETNNGGDLVGNTILALDPGVPFRKVTASRGKHLRAEPISLLSEQGRFHLVGNFPKLEEQLVAMASDGYTGAGSPDRLDALVWAASEVMLGGTTVTMFPDFRAAHRANGEPENAVHVVEVGEVKDWWTRWISVTIGSSSAAHWWCREPAQPGKIGSRSRIYREFLAQDMTPEEFGAGIAQRSQQEAKISRILPVWLAENAFSGIQGKSVAAAVAEGIQRSLGQHKAFLFVHDDEERGIVDPQQRWRTFSARMDRMPTGFLSVQPIKGKDSDGWDVVREMLRWRPAASGRLEGPDWDYARQLVLTDYPAYERYISEFKEPDVEVLPELLISNQCKGVIQAMSGAVRTNDDSALAMGGGSFVLQSLRIGALASREDASREPMQEFVGRKLAALPSGASGTARHMAAVKAEQDWGGQHGMGPISFSRKRK